MQLGAYPYYLGPIGINLAVIFLGLLVLALAIAQKIRVKRTHFFEISVLLFLVGFLFLTLHGSLLQSVLPISLPERPLIDNNLTFNYTLSNILTYMIFPLLVLIPLKNNISLEKLGLRVLDTRRTILYGFLGVIFNVFVFLIANSFFGFKWITEYTSQGLVLWILFVTFISVFVQTLFYLGILFNRYVTVENGFVLALISVLAFQLFAVASLTWFLVNIIASSSRVLVTWKTRNIYGAVIMGIVVNFLDVLVQIM